MQLALTKPDCRGMTFRKAITAAHIWEELGAAEQAKKKGGRKRKDKQQ